MEQQQPQQDLTEETLTLLADVDSLYQQSFVDLIAPQSGAVDPFLGQSGAGAPLTQYSVYTTGQTGAGAGAGAAAAAPALLYEVQDQQQSLVLQNEPMSGRRRPPPKRQRPMEGKGASSTLLFGPGALGLGSSATASLGTTKTTKTSQMSSSAGTSALPPTTTTISRNEPALTSTKYIGRCSSFEFIRDAYDSLIEPRVTTANVTGFPINTEQIKSHIAKSMFMNIALSDWSHRVQASRYVGIDELADIMIKALVQSGLAIR